MSKLEIERKYVIRLPDQDALSRIDGYECTEIIQTYLTAREGETRRVRARKYPERTVYTETSKLRVDGMSAIEREREIGETEYLRLVSEQAAGTRTIRKWRHSFPWCGLVIEIDVYPEWKRSCIMEIELPRRETEPCIPPFIKIIREVTGERKYSNASMARAFPEELSYL